MLYAKFGLKFRRWIFDLKAWTPFTQGWLVPSLIEIGPVVLEEMKMWKVYNDDANDNDDGQCSDQKNDQKSSREPSAQVG